MVDTKYPDVRLFDADWVKSDPRVPYGHLAVLNKGGWHIWAIKEEPMTKPTQADIDRLVKAGEEVVSKLNHGVTLHTNGFAHEGLKKALAPFQSDPEAELIDAMRWAFQDGQNQGRDWRDCMKMVLDVVKERELPS
jgi:hypothetical protein